jgi:hypothetical protein
MQPAESPQRVRCPSRERHQWSSELRAIYESSAQVRKPRAEELCHLKDSCACDGKSDDTRQPGYLQRHDGHGRLIRRFVIRSCDPGRTPGPRCRMAFVC